MVCLNTFSTNTDDVRQNTRANSHSIAESTSCHNATSTALGLPELFDRIVHFSTPVTSARLACLNRSSHERVTDFNRRYYDLDRSLKRFVQHPHRLRELLGQTGSCISGSFALQFMGGYFWPQSDMDIYTPRFRAYSICKFLIDEGFQYQPRSKQYTSLTREVVEPEHNVPFVSPQILLGSGGRMRGVENVYTFKMQAENTSELAVQVIEATDSPMHVVLNFHSSKRVFRLCTRLN